MNNKKQWGYSGSIAAALAASISAHATAAPEQTKPMEEVVISGSILGSSSLEEVRTYPGNRNVLTAEQLQKTASLSIDGALQRVPGIKIQDETGTGVLPNVAVRGLNASRSGHTQFLVDGIPLTLAPYGHTGQSLFPATLKTLDRIDIVRGGAAVQYGPNNVGGVINLITKEIPDEWQTTLAEKVTAFNAGNFLTDTYFSTGGQISDSFALQFEGNVIGGESFREHSDTDVKNWLLKTRWDIADDKTLKTTLQRYEAETEMPGALHTAAYKQNRRQSLRPNDLFQGDTTRFSTTYNQQLNDFGPFDAGEFNWSTFGHKSNRNFQWDFTTVPGAEHWADTRFSANILRSSPREFKVWGTEPRIAVQFGDASSVTHKVTLGSRLVKEDIAYQLRQTVKATGVTTVPRDWQLDNTGIAAYISDEIKLFDQRLTITPGVRYEHLDSTFKDKNANTTVDNTISEVLPGLTIGFEASDDWFVYANGQRSLRAPQIAVIRGTGEENAERAWNYEVGARYDFSQNGNVNMSLYRIDFDDQLLYNSTLRSFDNIGRTLHQGLELEVSYSPESLPRLDLHAGYNYLDSEQREGSNKGNELPYVSEHQLLWDASYAFDSFDATLSGFYFSSAFSDQGNTEAENAVGTVGELPSYTVWNLQLGKTMNLSQGSTLFAGLSVNNLFDKEYYFRGIDVSPAGRYSAPERSVSVEMKYTF
ncbi:MAG: TonB-dependent siderophore receptor [Pseudomonadales bacterium]